MTTGVRKQLKAFLIGRVVSKDDGTLSMVTISRNYDAAFVSYLENNELQ